ncbi:MAG TPA: response regulator, partial [Rhizomicrobium sp.]|nr:response regulator [Rhizomicrobium sp.]
AQALALLESGAAFAMAILDYQMPGMNGYELATRLKDNPATKALPLLLLTSVGQLGDLDEKISAHFAAMIVKPARTGQLADKVREIISHASGAPTVVQPAPAAIAPAKPVPASAPNPVAAEPIREAKPAEAAVAESEQAAPVAEAAPDKITILVAEDNEVNRRVIGAMLADGGYDIHFAHDGVQAVESYRKLQPDIVLMDVSMPHLDGLQATSKIRQLAVGANRTARVIGLTAHAMPDDRKICLDSGMDDYLPKPVNREKLLSLLKSSAA